jgi:hypothetical protein
MFPQVWQQVARGLYHSTEAVLGGFARYAVLGETYPGITMHPRCSVTGLLYFDVDEHDVAALDAFEGQDYQRIQIAGQVAPAYAEIVETYIYTNVNKLTEEPWHPEAFQPQQFLETYCRTPPEK